jgi:hypothetical protein
MKGKVMSFKSILKYIKNLFNTDKNTDKNLKPLLFIVNIKNIKLDSKVLKQYAEDGWSAKLFYKFKYSGYCYYNRPHKNYTLAQHKDWCLKELQARYKVPNGLIIDCDCEVYLSYITNEDFKAYCDNKLKPPFKTIDKRVF